MSSCRSSRLPHLLARCKRGQAARETGWLRKPWSRSDLRVATSMLPWPMAPSTSLGRASSMQDSRRRKGGSDANDRAARAGDATTEKAANRRDVGADGHSTGANNVHVGVHTTVDATKRGGARASESDLSEDALGRRGERVSASEQARSWPLRTSAWPSWTKWAIYLVVLFFTIDFVMGLGLSVILLLTYALLYVGLGLQRLFILFEEREDAHCRPWSRAPPRAAARRVAGRRMRRAKRIRRRSKKRTRERGDAVPDVWPRRKRSQTEIKFRHVAPRATRLFALIAVALLAGHRIGEADNPGPLQWGFDAPELDHEVYEDELDKLDGAAAQADYGWVEAGFEADWTGAMLPAEQAGHAMYDHGFLQTHEGQMDIADVDDADLLGMLGGAIPSTARRAWYDVPDDHLLREGPLTQEEEEVVIGARAEAVKLPEGLFEQLQAKGRAEAENAYVKWKDVLDKAQANRMARFGKSEPCRKTARDGESKQEDGRTMDEPVIEEDLEREVVMSDVAEEKSAEATSADLVTDGVRGHSGVDTPHRRRARGRRQRGARRVEIWTLNSSGKPQLEGALKTANEKKGAVVAVLNQEHHQTHDRVSDLQASARKYGWQVAAVGAVSGRGEGPSAGVSISTPKHISAGLQEGEKLDASPCDSPGRVAALWLQTVVPGGVLALSVYFYHSEKGSHRNVTLLCRALEAAHVARSPWLIAADCQEEPDDFLKWAAGPIQRAGGRIVSAAEPTHYPASGAAKNLDVFIVSDKLCPYVEAARVVDEVAAAPHRAVAIVFKPPAKPQLQWQLKAPRAFPRTRPISCQREPVAPVSAVDALDRAVTSGDKSQAASLAWRELIAAMEIELCGLTDRFAGGSPDPKFCGRAAGARYTRVPIMPPRAAGMWGEVDLKTHAMIWAENRLVEMARLSNIAVATIMGKEKKEIGECDMIETVKRGGAKSKNDKGEGSGLEDRQWRQWQRLTKKFTTAHCPIGEALSYDVRWAAVVKHVKLTGDNPAVAGRATAAAAAWARQMIVRQKRIHRKARAKGWNNWLQEEMRKGAGGAHAFAKRTVVNPDTLIEIKSVRTAAPCDVVEADFAKWDSTWTRLRDLSSAPWRGGGSSDDPCSRLPPLDVTTLRKSSRSFRITALGLDRIGPWHYEWGVRCAAIPARQVSPRSRELRNLAQRPHGGGDPPNSQGVGWQTPHWSIGQPDEGLGESAETACTEMARGVPAQLPVDDERKGRRQSGMGPDSNGGSCTADGARDCDSAGRLDESFRADNFGRGVVSWCSPWLSDAVATTRAGIVYCKEAPGVQRSL